MRYFAAMPNAFRRLGTGLLFLAVALCFAPTVIPPFLDRLYYDGPASGHFDGGRFFNPDRDADLPQAPVPGRGGLIGRFLSGDDQPPWPEQVDVVQTRPAPRIAGEAMVATWIGHASYLVQTAGINILTDPIWSDRAGPFGIGPRRVMAPGIAFEDLPRIDLVLISHNHYDHLDLPTLRRLWERDRPLIVTGLGNDTLMRSEGIEATARDWGDRVPVREGVEVVMARNFHWTSRWLTDRNRALWSAFAVRTPSGAIFFAGDTGWGGGAWAREAAAHGPYRLAILPIGAYAPREVMRSSHLNPGEALAVFDMLRPAMALGMHWGTFRLSWEGIDAPPRATAALARGTAAEGRFVTTEAGHSFRVPPLASQ